MDGLDNIIVNMLIALVVAGFLLQLLAWFVGRGSRESEADRLESEGMANRMERNAQLVRLLNEVRALPNLPNGQFSPEKQAVWDEYQKLNELDAELTKKEHELEIETRGYL